MRDGQGAGNRTRQDIWVPSHSDLCPRVCLDSLGTQYRLPGPHSREGLFSAVPLTQTRAPTAPSSGECPVLLTLQEREPEVSREQSHPCRSHHVHTPTVWAAEN